MLLVFRVWYLVKRFSRTTRGHTTKHQTLNTKHQILNTLVNRSFLDFFCEKVIIGIRN